MVAGKHKSRTFRRVKRVVPGNTVKTHFKKRKPSAAVCAITGKPLLGVPRAHPYQLQTMSKTEKRPERPFGGVLSSEAARGVIQAETRESYEESDLTLTDNNIFCLGRVCVKIAGRDARKIAVIVKELDESYVMIDGQTRRRKCNVAHLEPLPAVLKISEDASFSEVQKALKEVEIECEEKKTKEKKATERPKKQKVKKAADEKKAPAKKATPKKAATKEAPKTENKKPVSKE